MQSYNTRTTTAKESCDTQAVCGICNSVFADELSWCSHRPWKSVTHRDKCRWPNALRNRGGVWTLKPSCRKAVEIAEDGPVPEYRIKWPTPNGSPKKSRSRAPRKSLKTGPHNHAGSSAGPTANREGLA